MHQNKPRFSIMLLLLILLADNAVAVVGEKCLFIAAESECIELFYWNYYWATSAQKKAEPQNVSNRQSGLRMDRHCLKRHTPQPVDRLEITGWSKTIKLNNINAWPHLCRHYLVCAQPRRLCDLLLPKVSGLGHILVDHIADQRSLFLRYLTSGFRSYSRKICLSLGLS